MSIDRHELINDTSNTLYLHCGRSQFVEPLLLSAYWTFFTDGNSAPRLCDRFCILLHRIAAMLHNNCSTVIRLAWESQCKETMPLPQGPVVYEERMTPGCWLGSVLCLLQYFVGWITERTSTP